MPRRDLWLGPYAFWRSMPPSSRALFLAGVFCLFSTSGVLVDIADRGGNSLTRLVLTSSLTGTIALGYVVATWIGLRWLTVVIAVHVLIAARFDSVFGSSGPPLAGEALTARLALDVNVVSAAIVLSFGLLSQMIRVEGARYGRLRAEVAIARDIHGRLVPPIDARIEGFEFRGVSIPSGEVGGDLVDVVESPSGWTALLADVSGHGVGAGVLMGMIKSAVRSQLRSGIPLDMLQTTVSAVLYEVKSPAMFATFAAVQRDGGSLRFTVAGHLPILRHCAGAPQVDEVTMAQLPLAMFPDTRFGAGETTAAPGDLLVLLTDGLTEVFDRADREFGLDRIKALLVEHAGAPLAQIEERLLAAVRAHGRQMDDQTLLLMRCLA